MALLAAVSPSVRSILEWDVIHLTSPCCFTDVVYDCMHYALHHTKLPAYMREQKKYHLAHHYKNFELGFGVTSMFLTFLDSLVLNYHKKARYGT